MKPTITFYLIVFVWVNLTVARHPMENPGMFEGDMLGVDLNENRNAIPTDDLRWPGGVVTYEIDSTLGGDQLKIIRKAMKYIEKRTCIKFVPRNEEPDYVKIIQDEGCYSNWGRIGGEQLLSMGIGCEFMGIAIHELLHAIGFEHEHNRSDRDDFLTINWENIEEEWYFAFKKLLPSENRLLTPFDYDSIMLYGSTSFTNSHRVYSMLTKDGDVILEVFHRYHMSPSDIRRVKMLYRCPKSNNK